MSIFNQFPEFSFLKYQEGGESRKDVIARLTEAGIKAEPTTSPFVGQTAVRVLTRNKRLLNRAERLIYRP